ncbi:hypothetical protein PENANT_c011G06643 [Penicillium antarcticum]|uniref:Major facilitator superfamily (MFS) profile domain-containing protein n=1 Tax=Penicillium antarcticum TaxID=416450 RepID=A0A1V6Q7G2_9EURO|nr:hypothetical protein PENANT_c011G06643 [Penicillium antarcticum]
MADGEKSHGSSQVSTGPEGTAQSTSVQNSTRTYPKPTMLLHNNAMLMTCAIIFSYGVYQAIYEEMAKEPNTPFSGNSSSIISRIGTLSIALMSMGGPLIMTWAKLYGPQPVMMAGGLVFGIGCILASLSQYVWEFVLSQGLLVGLGTCMAYVPTMSVAPTWFDKRRGLAMGVIISGSACGGMIWPPVLRAITSAIGFCNALRISGCLVALFVPLAGSMRRLSTGKWPGRRNSSRRHWDVSCSRLDNFITISNAANFVSRIVIGYTADKFGRLNVLFLTTITSSVSVFAFWLPSTFAGGAVSTTAAEVLFILFAVLYVCFGSAYISLFPASLIELFGVQNFTSVNGAIYLIRGIGALLGTPLTSLLLPGQSALSDPSNYLRVSYTAGILVCSKCAKLWVRIEGSAGKKWTWKL